MKPMKDQEKCIKYVVKPNLRDKYPLLKEVVAVKSRKFEIKTKKVELFGQARSNLNKTLMYEFHDD